MNHLGDTNKMVETPRTDAMRGFHGLETAVDAEFSEQLELELNAANKRLEEIEKSGVYDGLPIDMALLDKESGDAALTYSIGLDLQKENNSLKDRIKRLEEALDLVRPHCDSVHHSKKHQHQYGELCPVVALIENAKEAKL